jgi:hypothetical protein
VLDARGGQIFSNPFAPHGRPDDEHAHHWPAGRRTGIAAQGLSSQDADANKPTAQNAARIHEQDWKLFGADLVIGVPCSGRRKVCAPSSRYTSIGALFTSAARELDRLRTGSRNAVSRSDSSAEYRRMCSYHIDD